MAYKRPKRGSFGQLMYMCVNEQTFLCMCVYEYALMSHTFVQ